MTIRTQIALDSEEYRRAKDRAAQLGVSFAEYVRRLVVSDLAGTRRSADAAVLFDLGDSGQSNIARRKDEYVGDALSAEWSLPLPDRWKRFDSGREVPDWVETIHRSRHER